MPHSYISVRSCPVSLGGVIRDYWSAVRAEWARIAEEKGGIGIQEEAETGTVISARLMQLADDIRAGSITTASAIAEARRLIDANTRRL